MAVDRGNEHSVRPLPVAKPSGAVRGGKFIDVEIIGGSIGEAAVTGATIDSTSTVAAGAWQTPSLLNSWVDYGSPHQAARYRKTNDTVQVEGLVKDGTTTNTTPIFVLPIGYRPAADIIVSVAMSAGSGELKVTSGGSVNVTNASATYTSLVFAFAI